MAFDQSGQGTDDRKESAISIELGLDRGGGAMKRLLIGIMGIVLFPVVSNGAPPASPRNDFQIVPGDRIGIVRLDMRPATVIALLGKPSGVEEAAGFKGTSWRAHKIRIFETADAGVLTSVQTFWVLGETNRYKTQKGIGVGATLRQIRDAYGDEGCIFIENPGARVVSWNSLGIFFSFSKQANLPTAILGKVTMIGVQPPTETTPRDSGACSALPE